MGIGQFWVPKVRSVINGTIFNQIWTVDMISGHLHLKNRNDQFGAILGPFGVHDPFWGFFFAQIFFLAKFFFIQGPKFQILSLFGAIYFYPNFFFGYPNFFCPNWSNFFFFPFFCGTFFFFFFTKRFFLHNFFYFLPHLEISQVIQVKIQVK